MYHYSMRHSEGLDLPIYAAAAALAEGQLVQFGTTADQDKGVYMIAAGAGTGVPLDVVGVVGAVVAAADRTDANPDGGSSATFGTLARVNIIMPGDLMCAEYDQSIQVDVASYAAPAVTITSMQDAFDGGWIYFPDDTAGETGLGQLGYAEASASETFTCRDSFTTAPDNTTDAILIMPIGSLVVALGALGVKLNTYAANTNYVTKFAVLKNQLTYRGKNGWVDMQPQLHSNLQLNGLAPKFRAIGFVRDLAAASID